MGGIGRWWSIVWVKGFITSRLFLVCLLSTALVADEKTYVFRSFWTLTGSPTLLSSAPLLALSHQKSITPAQTLFLLAQHLGITPLAGSTNEGRMKDGIEVEKIEIGGEEEEGVKELEKIVGAR